MAESRSSFIVLVLGALSISTVMMMGSANAQGESEPDVAITNEFSGCQPRVECAPYEDDVLFRLNEVYRFTFDVNPSETSISCTIQCVADDAPSSSLVSFVAATRGTSTKYFQWSIRSDGGYVQWLDANQTVIKSLTKEWSF
ncbi:hypothetical protein KP509_23G061100 [Ceratopteris richardii]|uniref:Uncharacterized protein n=1 Tax=Ceratopteris richardii TaxID=49495 RepID=A0A8T2S336_CERRI|nr:hypothetical protein KP509_23G061100 [Ceratopteris richardii]